MITCLIVDDELFAREELADLLGQEHDIQIVGQCANAIEALQSITKEKPQLIFLDIQMPRISGMELIAMLDPDDMPKIVFVTAYDEFAVKAFDNHAFDYLLKPIDADRLSKTLTRVRKNLTPQAMDSITPKSLEHIPCYSGNKLKVIAIQDVEYVFSDLSGIHVASTKGKVHTQLTLKVFEEKTPLVRCHRQYLISPKAIAEIELLDTGAEVTTHLGDKVPVSRRYLKSLKQLFGFQ
ncbi:MULTISPECIES: two-component system response regulator BtsR [Shewanella]|uniref:Two-component system response regulator BtsR n=1 Tax=Shewanella oncorhynchi TaxID=2726434 RepID=A0ABX1KKX9_9GAMM|nr:MULTISPECIES: two-component system response regulator BtsR [unclassified Shewanella]MBI1673688.1 two-component system response regulator BtsR [Shewanella sp. DW31]MBW3515487.1 two-component system response regulator BtsR [Shewanella sp. NKUCC01_JLK]NLQ22261.1 two-component system response regulator BtsR [Shewanella oncorhynchi]RBP82794.1 LytTR family two component transcriptional regulator [Shewanella putrefaciens]GCF89091.1 putative response regulatory protein [Shewanella sp. M-Br]